MKTLIKYTLLIVYGTLMVVPQAFSHHVLGRPSYSLNEDSNTPPSMQVETQIGEYYVSYMVFPAFPRANEAGRVNLYATRIDNGQPLDTRVTFKIRDDSWLSSREEKLGTQQLDDNIYRQGFVFQEDGDYIITAQFHANGEPYTLDFPLRVGQTNALSPVGITLVVIVLILFAVKLLKHRTSKRHVTKSPNRELHT